MKHAVVGMIVAACAAHGIAPACGQSYPSRPVRIVVPYPPGGGTDIVARTLAQKLTETLGQPFVVDNRAGANGIIGTDHVAKSKPDGYTVLITIATHAINPTLYAKLPYDYRIVRPDMRGLGLSSQDFDLETEMSVPELVADLVGVIDALGAASVHFCGESMGGILGIALAAGHPARIRTLSLVSTPVFISDRMKETYALQHGSRADAMREMGITSRLQPARLTC